MSLSSRKEDNFVQWDKRKKNFFETYYIKWNDPKQQQAGWLRYTIYNSTSQKPESAVWGTFIDKQVLHRNIEIKQTFPVDKVECEKDSTRLVIERSGIDHTEAWGEITSNKAKLKWKVRVTNEGLMVRQMPKLVYKKFSPVTKFVAPFCWYKLSGEIQINSETIKLDNVPAHQAHFWGTKQVASWAWGNCGTFNEDPSFFFEGVAAKINLPGKLMPTMTCLIFHWEGKTYRSNGLVDAFLKNKSENDMFCWKFQTECDGLLFLGEMQSTPEEMIMYRFQDPDGEYRYSHNNFHARLRIHIYKKEKGHWQKIKTFTSENSAFEVAIPEYDTRVKRVLQ
jgi:hypothetical protein